MTMNALQAASVGLTTFDFSDTVKHATCSAVERRARLSSSARGTRCRKGSHTSFRGIRCFARCPGTEQRARSSESPQPMAHPTQCNRSSTCVAASNQSSMAHAALNIYVCAFLLRDFDSRTCPLLTRGFIPASSCAARIGARSCREFGVQSKNSKQKTGHTNCH